ncbi:universal stress protein [Aestuariispira ectoiniformans]|uniref:universal stress protein n=1 Tax=Aestuariispira ectoiniformans TaxID=2775080 RepID=UPI00223AB3F8|nr:universal stress protein [Aestuariispira ectoiniformans]
MYKSIMVPVDLEHQDKLGKALTTAGLFAKEFKADLTLVGVTPTVPTAVAHTPEEFAQKLKDFGERQAGVLGVPVQTKAVTSADPARDLDDALDKAAHELGADLVVMGTHMPGIYEHVFSSNAGYLASHSDISVFVVR